MKITIECFETAIASRLQEDLKIARQNGKAPGQIIFPVARRSLSRAAIDMKPEPSFEKRLLKETISTLVQSLLHDLKVIPRTSQYPYERCRDEWIRSLPNTRKFLMA